MYHETRDYERDIDNFVRNSREGNHSKFYQALCACAFCSHLIGGCVTICLFRCPACINGCPANPYHEVASFENFPFKGKAEERKKKKV